MDMFLQQPIGDNANIFLNKFRAFLLNTLREKKDAPLLLSDELSEKLSVFRYLINSLSENFFQETIESHVLNNEETERLFRPIKETYDILKKSFSAEGVFCCTTKKDNLLMWAHYADRHYGGVVEFTPSIKIDSLFLAAKEINYTTTRPMLYRTPEDMFKYLLQTPRRDAIHQIIEQLTYSKSLEWSYENEWRVSIPNFIKEDEKYKIHNFHPSELTAVYLGCRMSDLAIIRTIELARGINSQVKIYQSQPSNTDYKLEFFELKIP